MVRAELKGWGVWLKQKEEEDKGEHWEEEGEDGRGWCVVRAELKGWGVWLKQKEEEDKGEHWEEEGEDGWEVE